MGVVPLKFNVSLSDIHVINLSCKMFRVQKLNICLSVIKETKHNLLKGSECLKLNSRRKEKLLTE